MRHILPFFFVCLEKKLRTPEKKLSAIRENSITCPRKFYQLIKENLSADNLNSIS